MEGYTNISGNHEDFDDLDIEGRITLDEWNCEDDDKKPKENSANDREEKHLLSLKVKLNSGGYGYVFSVKNTDHSIRWRCHLCDVLIIGQKHVETHIQSKKHQVRMALPSHAPELFKRIETKPSVDMPTLAPGEPVPPGFEDVVKRVTQIQATLDSHTSSSLIGLEYLVELTPDESGKEPKYVCMLCDKKGDPRVAMAHITSLNHRQKYIGIHFPTANKAMFHDIPRTKDGKRAAMEIVNKICTKIEEKYGRLHPLVVERETFELKKEQIMKQIQMERHFKESEEETFVDLVSMNILDSLAEDDESKTENKSDTESKSTFVKGKISCDRSRLRTRGPVDAEDDMKFGKFEIETKKPNSGGKKMPLNKAGRSRRSLSSLSSLSSSSRSRSSHSRSRSSRSRSRSYSRQRYSRRGWKKGKYSKGRFRRSRSGSRGWRRSRSGSRSRSRRSRSFSPGSRYQRRGSPDSPSKRNHYGHSRSPKHNRYGENDDRFNKYRDKAEKSTNLDPRIIEKSKWMKFRKIVDKVERELAKELKFHEKNPEKHPMYPEEWKKFWNRRYKELQTSGQDPSKHDFKPEWIEFWNKRMKEMHEESLKTKKEEIRLTLGLPKEDELMPRKINKNRAGQDSDVIVISPPKNEEHVVKKDVTVTDIKNTWKALTGSDIKDTSKRSPSPWEEGEPLAKHPKGLSPSRRSMRGGNNLRGRGRGRSFPIKSDDFGDCGIVTILRFLTALENQLGSLGPRVNTLLASALSLEKISSNSSNQLLADSENFVLLETVKEKLKGQLLAGIVERNMVMATRSCISSLADALYKAEESGMTASASKVTETVSAVPSVPAAIVSSTPVATAVAVAASTPAPAPAPAPPVEPVTVPGVGTMDKVAIAQQIASALVAQGKTDVTQEELEQLINAVVGMAQASAGSEHPISTASYVSQLQEQHSGSKDSPSSDKHTHKIPEGTSIQKLLSVATNAGSSKTGAKTDSKTSALALLQSAYDEPKVSPDGSLLIPTKVPANQKFNVKDPMSLFKNLSPSSGNVGSGQHLNKSDIDMDDLTEDDLQTLLQNFKDLSTEEQQCLITYLKKLETKDPVRVEKLRQFVNLEGYSPQKPVQNLKSSIKSVTPVNRTFERSRQLSPFSLRHGGINPESEETENELPNQESEDQKKSLKLEDSDDDYSFEDIYKAASQKVKEREKAKLEEEKAKQMAEEEKSKDDKSGILKNKTDDPSLILKETKEMIANLMGQLPSKFIQKQTGSPGSRKDSPSVLGHQQNAGAPIQRTETIKSNTEMGGQRIQALGNNASQIPSSAQTVPTLDTSRHMYQDNYPNSGMYNNQYSSQNFPGNQQSYPGVQQPDYSSGYQQNNGYYGNMQQPYPPQNQGGNYNEGYSNQGQSAGWGQYPQQYGQQQYQRHPAPAPAPAPYSQYPNQSSSYY